MKIPFNQPPFVGTEFDYVRAAVESGRICGDGQFNQKCHAWLQQKTGVARALLTTSCTHALEMSALICGIKPGDEVIMPSFTFVSTADAFAMRGAKCVFVDIRPDTMNIDEKLIEAAITEKTRAIVPVHYAGVACEMDAINAIAKKHNLFVIEDAAQGMMSTYKGRSLGALGDFGCYSFHETKNYSMGEGGAILIADKKYSDHAEIIREKLLWNLDREIPHGTAVEITKFSERDDGIIDLEATIYCEKASHKGIIIGKHGAMLKKIGQYAREDLEKFFEIKVNLQCWVKVKEGWRNREGLIHNFGLD